MKKGILFVCLLAVVLCCKKKSSSAETDNFNKTALMENIGVNLAMDNYTELDLKLTDFKTKYETFIGDQTQSNFEAVQSSWTSTYVQWERSLMYEFGPAMNELMKASFGTFPTDTTKILNNISSGTYNLDQVANYTAQGLPAFDFLLYRQNAMSFFSQPAYAQYGTDLINKMQGHVSSVLSAWNSGYLAAFKGSTGTEATSAFSQLINSFVKSYEECKWTKIGIPIGNQSMGELKPEFMETRKAKRSFELMRENLLALQRLFNGDNNDGNAGVGFDDYLIALDKAELSQSINADFQEIHDMINAFATDFETTLNTDPNALQQLYTKVHLLTIPLKTDMTSAFGVLITYQDNDGD